MYIGRLTYGHLELLNAARAEIENRTSSAICPALRRLSNRHFYSNFEYPLTELIRQLIEPYTYLDQFVKHHLPQFAGYPKFSTIEKEFQINVRLHFIDNVLKPIVQYFIETGTIHSPNLMADWLKLFKTFQEERQKQYESGLLFSRFSKPIF